MLPHVEAKEWRLPFHERVVLVRRARDRQPAPLVEQPHPAAAETTDARFCPLLLERVETAKGGGDGVGDFARRRSARIRRHPRPELRVVPVPTAVVTDRRANGL